MKLKIGLIVLFSSILFYGDLLRPGVPFTHDGQNHVARMANYYLALKQGQVPPRLAPNLNNGFGYPVFNYNYPLANIISVPLTVLGFNLQTTFKVIIFLSLIGAGIGIYRWLSLEFKSEVLAVLGTLFYMSANYLYSLVFIRGVIGEILAYSLLPWLFWSIKKQSIKKKQSPVDEIVFSVLLASFLLAHNIIAYFSVPIIAVYTLILYRDKLGKLRDLVKPIFISFLLVSFFWLPALGEKSATILDAASIQTEYLDHFPSLTQLVSVVWEYGFSTPAPVDGMSFGWGSLAVLTLVLSFIMWVRKSSKPRVPTFFILAGLTIFILQLKQAAWIWQLIPLGNYIQFPWRLGFFGPLIMAYLLAWVSTQVPRKFVYLIGLVLIFMAIIAPRSRFATFDHEDDYWHQYTMTTSVLDENMPIWFQKEKAYALDQTIFKEMPVYASDGTVKINSWTGSKMSYHVQSTASAEVVQRTAYFPGWQVKLNGQRIELGPENQAHPGLISFEVPAGSNQIEARFTQLTPVRIVGNLLSFIGLTYLGYMIIMTSRIKDSE